DPDQEDGPDGDEDGELAPAGVVPHGGPAGSSPPSPEGTAIRSRRARRARSAARRLSRGGGGGNRPPPIAARGFGEPLHGEPVGGLELAGQRARPEAPAEDDVHLGRDQEHVGGK